MTDVVQAETINAVRWIRLNRPEKLNALSDDLKVAFRQAVQDAADDDAVRCIVITGNGRAFCAGGDVSTMGGRGPEATFHRVLGSTSVLSTLLGCNKPTIAALNGLAAGAGASLALVCDLAFAIEEAWLSFIFVERGLVPDFASSYFLPRIVGLGAARQLMLTARRVPASEARELRILADVFAKDEFEQRVQAQAEQLAEGNIAAMALIRRLLTSSFETDFRTALEREAMGQALASTLKEHHQAVEKFTSREKPATGTGSGEGSHG